MKLHTRYGRDALARAERVLGSSSFLKYAGVIAYTHHERWDGTGYPRGVAGEAIPLCGRLMAVADVYDALISSRVYKEPLPHSKAVAIIAEGSGSQFDPALVEGFLALRETFRRTALEFADSEAEKAAVSSG